MTEERLSTEDIAQRGGEADMAEDLSRGVRGRESAVAESREPLLDQSDLGHFRDRWESIQTRFVDEPRESVEQADSLVAEVMQQVSRKFSDERKLLEDQWERDEEVSTEDLRVALTRYRSFFDRLLSA